MFCKSRTFYITLAVGALVLASDNSSPTGDFAGIDPPDGIGSGAALPAGLLQFSPVRTAEAATRDCRMRRGDVGRGARNRRCVQRNPYNFSNGADISSDPQLSPDARFLVFVSLENLDDAAGDLPATGEFEFKASPDIFRLDVDNDVLRRVSVDEAGALPPRIDTEFGSGLASSVSPAITANGRRVAFATNGVFLPEDPNNEGDVYVKDLHTGRLTLVSTVIDGRASSSAAGGVAVIGDNGGGDSRPVTSVAMSANGRFVAFMTTVEYDPSRDDNGLLDIYVKDLRKNRFFLASFGADGRAGGIAPADTRLLNVDNVEISANGRFVAFTSPEPLDPADDNEQLDIYVWDRRHPDMPPILASVGADLQPPPFGIFGKFALSANGRFVTFGGTINDLTDLYRYDRVKRRTIRVSLDAEGRETVSGGFGDSAMSADGRFVAFSSFASDLVLDDTSQFEEVFVKDLRTGAITRASVDEDGVEPDGSSFSPTLSANGEVIAFITDDANLLIAPPGSEGAGDTVVVTAVDFAALPLTDIPGAPPGAVNVENFALRSTIDRPNDQDWFRVFLSAERIYQIDLEGRPTRQGTLDDPLLRISVPKIPGVDLDLGRQDDDGGVGLNARLVFRPTVDGTYFISAEGFGAATGTYRLFVREMIP